MNDLGKVVQEVMDVMTVIPDLTDKVWRCWASKPTYEQRKETPWE